jgi:hypothetical protein
MQEIRKKEGDERKTTTQTPRKERRDIREGRSQALNLRNKKKLIFPKKKKEYTAKTNNREKSESSPVR